MVNSHLQKKKLIKKCYFLVLGTYKLENKILKCLSLWNITSKKSLNDFFLKYHHIKHALKHFEKKIHKTHTGATLHSSLLDSEWSYECIDFTMMYIFF